LKITTPLHRGVIIPFIGKKIMIIFFSLYTYQTMHDISDNLSQIFNVGDGEVPSISLLHGPNFYIVNKCAYGY